VAIKSTSIEFALFYNSSTSIWMAISFKVNNT